MFIELSMIPITFDRVPLMADLTLIGDIIKLRSDILFRKLNVVPAIDLSSYLEL